MKVDRALDVDGPLDPRGEAAHAEQAGYDGFWLSELAHDPFLGLALAATATEKVDLGTSIALAFARNPMSTAVLANDLQALSRGRLQLGLGTQIKAHVTRRFGMPWSQPAARMREYLLAMRAIWDAWQTGSRLDFRGEFYTHTLMTPMFTPPPHEYGPPQVLLAGVGAGITEVAGEVADGFVAHPFTTERYLHEVTLPALARGRHKTRRTGDDFQISGLPFVATGRTDEEMAAAAHAVRSRIAFYGSTPAYRGVLELHGWGALGDELYALSRAGRWAEMGERVTDDVVDAFAVVGEPAKVVGELLRRYGDVFTRLTLDTPYPIARDLADEVAAGVRSASGEW
jgi:probable F420-dependent oxidoreductase